MRKLLFLSAFALIFGVAIAQEQRPVPEEKTPMEKPDKAPELPDSIKSKMLQTNTPPQEKSCEKK